MNKNRILAPILFACLFSGTCQNHETTHFHFTDEHIILKIKSVSPAGDYAIVNICDLSNNQIEMREYYSSVMHLLFDLKNHECWPLVDTTTFYNVPYFAWSENSKNILISAALRHPKDTLEIFPIYLYNLESRTILNLLRPWLNIPHYSIPLFSHHKGEIIFWAPGVIVDTLKLSANTTGRVFKWDTLQRSIVKIIENEDIASARWLGLSDATDLFIQANNILWRLSLSTYQLENVSPDVWLTRRARRFQNKITFPGMSKEQQNSIYVYDIERNSLEAIMVCNIGVLLSVSINISNKFAVEVKRENDYWIYLMTKEGGILDSLQGYTSFWLANTDSLIYSEGKKIVLAYWLNDELKKKTILEIIE